MIEPVALPTFQADGSIIQEQPDHLVIAVRIPKATVNANLHLLAALVDRAGAGAAPWSPALDPPKKVRKPHWGYAALIFAAFTVPSPFLSSSDIRSYAMSYMRPPPPVEIESIKPASATFKVGESVDIVFHFRRDRVCRTTYDHIIERAAGETPVFNMRVYGASNPPTHGQARDFHLILNPPTALPPGDYIYTGYTHSECEQGGVYDTPHESVAFTIVD